jgi:hypothetical protein
MYGPDFPDHFFDTLFVLAIIGLISAIGAAGYLLYLIVTHIRIV